MDSPLDDIRALTFDFYGTLADAAAMIVPEIAAFLSRAQAGVDPGALFVDWFSKRSYNLCVDALLGGHHTPFSTINRRALAYVLARHRIPFTPEDEDALVAAWSRTRPYPDVMAELPRLGDRFKLVIVTNIDRDALETVSAPFPVRFDALISSADAGTYKPSPKVFLHAAGVLGLAPPHILHVAAGASEMAGARAAGMRAALVNRHAAPVEVEPSPPDLVVRDFHELAARLAG
jgi:2-haloacid dehalogenase